MRSPLKNPLPRAVTAGLWLTSVACAWYVGTRMAPPAADSAKPTPRAVMLAESPLGRSAASPNNGGVAGVAKDTKAVEGGAFPARLISLQALPPGPAKNGRIVELFADWATADPLAALAGADSVPELGFRADLRETVMRRWGAADPEKAWAHAMANPDGELPERRLEMVLDGIGRGDVQAALQFFSKHQDDLGKHLDRAALVLDDLYERGNHESLIPWAEKLPPGKWKDTAMNRLVDRWARYDPEAAKTWMDRAITSPDALKEARVELADSWARVNPTAALGWLDTLPAADRSSALYAKVFGKWIEFDPNAAGGYLAAQPPGPLLDRPIEQYTNEVMKQNPADTMPWAESIGDDRRRWRAIERVAEQWRRRDPAGLENYVRSAGFTDKEKARLLPPPKKNDSARQPR